MIRYENSVVSVDLGYPAKVMADPALKEAAKETLVDKTSTVLASSIALSDRALHYVDERSNGAVARIKTQGTELRQRLRTDLDLDTKLASAKDLASTTLSKIGEAEAVKPWVPSVMSLVCSCTALLTMIYEATLSKVNGEAEPSPTSAPVGDAPPASAMVDSNSAKKEE